MTHLSLDGRPPGQVPRPAPRVRPGFPTLAAALAAALPLAVTSVTLLPVGDALAADLAAGRSAAGQCNVCHGKDGIATNPEAPNLAGEASVYIEKQLKAFRSGERQHRQMSIVAQGLDDETIKDLAAWYDAMIVSVELPSTD